MEGAHGRARRSSASRPRRVIPPASTGARSSGRWGWSATAARCSTKSRRGPRLARVAIDNEVGRLLAYETTVVKSRGDLPIVEGSITNLYVTEALVRAASNLLDLAGADGVVQHGGAGAPAGGWIEHVFRHSQVMTIHSGTSEIQRNIIAERGLGLPRTR